MSDEGKNKVPTTKPIRASERVDTLQPLSIVGQAIKAHEATNVGAVQSAYDATMIGSLGKAIEAASCAFAISYAVTQLIRPRFENKYAPVKNANFSIAHATGIDTGTTFIVRGGARGTNDLISIGRAPNLAAKLSDIRSGNYTTFISSSIFNNMHGSVKARLNGQEDTWEYETWNFIGENVGYYRSSYWRKPGL